MPLYYTNFISYKSKDRAITISLSVTGHVSFVRPSICFLFTAVYPAKAAHATKIPFGEVSQVGPKIMY